MRLPVWITGTIWSVAGFGTVRPERFGVSPVFSHGVRQRARKKNLPAMAQTGKVRVEKAQQRKGDDPIWKPLWSGRPGPLWPAMRRIMYIMMPTCWWRARRSKPSANIWTRRRTRWSMQGTALSIPVSSTPITTFSRPLYGIWRPSTTPIWPCRTGSTRSIAFFRSSTTRWSTTPPSPPWPIF